MKNITLLLAAALIAIGTYAQTTASKPATKASAQGPTVKPMKIQPAPKPTKPASKPVQPAPKPSGGGAK